MAITEAMLAAGARELASYDPATETREQAAQRIYEAMAVISDVIVLASGPGIVRKISADDIPA